MFNLKEPYELLNIPEVPAGFSVLKQGSFVYPVFNGEKGIQRIFRDFVTAKFPATRDGIIQAIKVCMEEDEEPKPGPESPLGRDPHYPW